jgi:hypothetical protein
MESLFMADDNESTIPVHEQPHPQQAYRLTMTIENAPGPFGEVTGNAQYDVANRRECSKRDPVSGTVGRITHLPDLTWTPIAPNTYEAIVYVDRLLDEDYYGLGVCHWELKGASGSLRATGNARETRFMPAMDYDEIFAEKTKVLYFWNGNYPTDTPPPSNGKGFPEFGDLNLDKAPSEQRDQFFTITLSARKVQP